MVKYFDKLKLDDVFITPGRTITETDVVTFSGLSGDYNEIHSNREVMKNSQFGGVLVHGLLGLSISHGLIFRLGLLDGSGIAFLEVDKWQFKAPIYIGDTIHVRISVSDLRKSASKPDRGIVSFLVDVINQNEVTVQSGIKKILMKRKTGSK